MKQGKNSGKSRSFKGTHKDSRQIERNKRREIMEASTSLEIYRTDKFDNRKENIKDNSKCKALFFGARGVCLRTKSLRGSIHKIMWYSWSAKKNKLCGTSC